jgi:membrane-bound metal-dependent hydrolase YbcI (DUF457 family)
VDPLSHAAFGYTVVRAARAPMPRLAVAASVGALAPDLDSVLMPFGWDIYLRAHEIGTHTVIASLPIAILVAVAVRGRSRSRLLPLFAIAWLAVMSHLFLDVVSGARIQVGWPLVNGRTMVPLVAMAEPWLLVACVAAVAAMAIANAHARRAARVALVAIALCLAVKGIWLLQALTTLPAATQATVVDRIVEAQWATLRQWTAFVRTPTELSRIRIAPHQTPETLDTWPIASEFPLAAHSRELGAVRNLQAVHELTFAREHRTQDGSTEVLWSDIRFCWRPSENARSERGPLALGSGAAHIACAVWVGGTFDRAGRAINQRVQVFGLWQTRPAPP